MRWAQASPPFGEGRLLRGRRPAPGSHRGGRQSLALSLGGDSPSLMDPAQGLPGRPAARLCGFLAGHIPVTLEHSCTRRGPAVTRIPCLKGFPGSGRGAAITPGLLLTAREGGGWSSGRRTRVGGKSSGCRRSGGSLSGAQLRLEAEPPTGLRTARGAAAALGKAGSLPGLDPLSPGPSAGQVLPWQPHVQPVCPLGGHIASPPVPGDPAT